MAKFKLGGLSLSQFPEIALKLLENGIESESLIILAGMSKQDNSFEIKEYLDRTIDELGVDIYEFNEAAFILANYYLKEFKNGNLNVGEAIVKIHGECWGNIFVEIVSEKYIYDSIKFGKIIALWFDYDEVDEYVDWVKRSKKSLNQIKTKMEEDLGSNLLLWEDEFLKSKIAEIKKLKSS